MNQRMWRALGISVSGVTGALLLGITKIVNVDVNTNLFSTGITPAVVFGILSLALAFAIFKNRV